MSKPNPIKEFKPSNLMGFLHLFSPLIFVAIGLHLSLTNTFGWLFILGQISLSIFFFQCFILQQILWEKIEIIRVRGIVAGS